MKIIKIKSNLTVVMSNGDIIIEPNCTDEMYNDIVANQGNEDYVLKKLTPVVHQQKEKIKAAEQLENNLDKSKILFKVGASVYMPEISEFSLPTDFVEKIVEAELNNNQDLIKAYKNFWLLCCLNPDSRIRNNIFWFLTKYGMEITSSGLFVAYRNVDIKKEGKTINNTLTKFITDKFMHVRYKLKKAAKNYFVGKLEGELVANINKDKVGEEIGNLQELYNNLSSTESEEVTVYTDSYTQTFNIQIGKLVSMPRMFCDAVQENDCSRGLHVGGKTWLRQNYFGSESIRVLVNPTDVVAVPPKDKYGKMRTCAYMPIQVVSFKNGEIDAYDISGFEDDFFSQINYDKSKIGTDSVLYELEIQKVYELDYTKIKRKLDSIREQIKKKEA